MFYCKIHIHSETFHYARPLNKKQRIMIYDEREIRRETVIEAAKQMMTAARTAPKAKGCDIMEIKLVTGDDITTLADALRTTGEKRQRQGMIRDAGNLLSADAVLLIGTRNVAMGLNCAYCGASTCDAREQGVPCTMNSIDLGIAIGSACATAADCRLDTRVMYSAGYAAKELGWFPQCGSVIAIPVSAGSKNPFFDR